MGGVSDWQTAARETARRLLPAPDSLSLESYIAQVVQSALEAGGKRDREEDIRRQAERIARHAWDAIGPRLHKRKPV